MVLGIVRWRWKHDLHWAWFAVAIVVPLLVSCFVAWRGVHRQTQDQQVSIEQLTSDNADLQAKAVEQRDEITRLTAELARRPSLPDLNVTVASPQKPAPMIWWSPKSLPATPGAKGQDYSVEVTIGSDTELVQAELRLECSTPVDSIECTMPEWDNYNPKISGSDVKLELGSPKLSPRHPWIFAVHARKPIRILALHWLGGPPTPTIVAQ